MHTFHIGYRDTQGTLMRILGAASRRGIDLPHVQAGPTDNAHQVTLLLDVNTKQVGQLFRDWHAIVDVTDVCIGAAMEQSWSNPRIGMPHPPESVGAGENARTATA